MGQFKIRTFLLTLLLLLLNVSCATGDGPTLNYSLEDFDRAIRKMIPGGVAHISENGRTYFGNYFDPYQLDHKTNGPNDKRDFRRCRAVATITGDRRPYEFEVTVYVEVRARGSRLPASQKLNLNKGQFVQHDTSPAMEANVLNSIRAALKDRNAKANFIDNFQPF